MDIDLEDELRSEIDDLHFEVGELRTMVEKLVKKLNPPMQFDQGKIDPKLFSDWIDKDLIVAQKQKNKDASHVMDAVRYGTGISKLWMEDKCKSLGIDPKTVLK